MLSITVDAIDGLLRTLAASTATTARFSGLEVTSVMPAPFWTILAGSSTIAAQKFVGLKSWVTLIDPETVVLAPGARSPPKPQRYGSSVASSPAEPTPTRNLPGSEANCWVK